MPSKCVGNERAQHYKDLVAWQKAMDLVTDVYKVTDHFPPKEISSLTNQMRRAAGSVPSNIAEGQALYNPKEFLHFLRHSAGSLAELETQAIIAQRLNYLGQDETDQLLQRLHEGGRILSGLINSLRTER